MMNNIKLLICRVILVIMTLCVIGMFFLPWFNFSAIIPGMNDVTLYTLIKYTVVNEGELAGFLRTTPLGLNFGILVIGLLSIITLVMLVIFLLRLFSAGNYEKTYRRMRSMNMAVIVALASFFLVIKLGGTYTVYLMSFCIIAVIARIICFIMSKVCEKSISERTIVGDRKRYVFTEKMENNIVTYSVLIIVALIFVFPCLWLILASLSKSGSLYDFKGFFPKEYSIQTFIALFNDDVNGLYPYKKWFMNTLIVASASCFLGTILVILTAYVMSAFRFKGRDTIKKVTLVLGMFPGFMGMVAIYIIMIQFGLQGKLIALVLLYSATAPMGYLVQKGFFDTIPHTLGEAARIDGATNARVFVSITLPLSKPIIVYTALSSFAWPWSDYLLPNLILKDRDTWTVAVGLLNIPAETHFARFAAGSVFIAIPIVVLYFCLIKNIVQGMTAGAVKG